MNHDEVLAFYSAAATRNGWENHGWEHIDFAPGSPEYLVNVTGDCYSKAIGEVAAYLRVFFPGDDGSTIPTFEHPPSSAFEELSIFSLEITASHEDRLGC